MVRVVLVGGASLTGKSTFARGLAARLGAEVVATDGLGRHPGRPWPAPRAHVAEFYRRLSAEAIDAFLLDHHGNLWPHIERLIQGHLDVGGSPLVLEGSALRPELAAARLADGRVRGVWLTASRDAISARIARLSGRAQAPPALAEIIDVFMARTLRDADRVREAIDRHGLEALDAADDEALARVLDEFSGATDPD
ncbi:MAG: hypothetical protein V2J24_14095 [Pseudomonadales bacterium]|nr:hypothetical protein [Pseudomonadales bacterium]